MGRTTHENTRVFWLDTVANIQAPTVAELGAGDELTDQIPVDGVEFSPSRNTASQAMLGDAFVAEQVGTWSESCTLTFVRDDEDDVARALFETYRTEGFLVIARFGTIAASDAVEVYPAQSHVVADLATAENEFSKFQVQLAITSAPAKNAAVAA